MRHGNVHFNLYFAAARFFIPSRLRDVGFSLISMRLVVCWSINFLFYTTRRHLALCMWTLILHFVSKIDFNVTHLSRTRSPKSPFLNIFDYISVFTSYPVHAIHPENFAFPSSMQGEYLALLVKKQTAQARGCAWENCRTKTWREDSTSETWVWTGEKMLTYKTYKQILRKEGDVMLMVWYGSGYGPRSREPVPLKDLVSTRDGICSASASQSASRRLWYMALTGQSKVVRRMKGKPICLSSPVGPNTCLKTLLHSLKSYSETGKWADYRRLFATFYSRHPPPPDPTPANQNVFQLHTYTFSLTYYCRLVLGSDWSNSHTILSAHSLLLNQRILNYLNMLYNFQKRWRVQTRNRCVRTQSNGAWAFVNTVK
jgi:hypothetical protein